MEFQHTLNVIIGVAFTACGWFAREMWDAVKELKVDLAKLREELPKDYTSKSDFENVLNRIDLKLDRLFDKIDSKVDKP